APVLDQLPDAVDVAALFFLLFQRVEQARRALLLRRGDREEIAAAAPPFVDDAGDLIVRVEPEVPRWLPVWRIQSRIVNGCNHRHSMTPSGYRQCIWPGGELRRVANSETLPILLADRLCHPRGHEPQIEEDQEEPPPGCSPQHPQG